MSEDRQPFARRSSRRETTLPGYAEVTVVCAHPDDESFGLGALITAFARAGARVRLVCLTAGEHSTLGASEDLGVRRAGELDCAARELGIDAVTLLHHPDGALATVPLRQLTAEILAAGPQTEALLTFDRGGVTGHPDHDRATQAAVSVGRELGRPVWGWAIREQVAVVLRGEFSVPFVGRDEQDLDLVVPVDRAAQQRAISCRGSQLQDNRIPSRRIELSAGTEVVRLLHDPTLHAPASRPGDGTA